MVFPLPFGLLLAFIHLVLAKEQPQTFFSVAFPKVCVSSSDISFSVTLPPLDGSLPWDSALLKIEDKDTHKTYVNMTIDVYATAENKTEYYHTSFEYTDKLRISKFGKVSLKCTVESLRNGSALTAMGPTEVFLIPGWVTIFPPIVTLAFAIATKMTMVSLILGIFTGALFVCRYDPVTAFLRTFDTYFLGSFCESDHAAIMLFTFLLGGLLGMVQKSGGSKGLANTVQALAGRSRDSILAVAFVLGLVVFFDDYSCILITGSAIKPIVSDPSFGISAEKVTFIVHNLGVCLASMAPVSSWLGAELSYIQQQYEALGIETNAFEVFVAGLPWRIFPILMVLYTGALVFVRRDFGPLLTAEIKATMRARTPAESPAKDLTDPLLDTREEITDTSTDTEPTTEPNTDPLDPSPDTKPQWFNAVVPFSLIIVLTLLGMYFNGADALREQDQAVTFTAAIGASDSITALIWSSAVSTVVLMVMVAAQWRCLRISMGTMMEAWVLGVKEMVEPMLILILAWGLGDVISDVETAKFLSGALQGGFPGWLIAPLSLLMSMVISFTTGSAMGTMGILFPLSIPIAYDLSDGDEQLLVRTSAVIFAGCAFGNCCSPIADTTILSSMATGCKIPDHLKTTVPHCMLVAGASLVATFFAELPYGVAVSWAVALTPVVFAFVFLSKNPARPDQMSLLKRLCPCIRCPSFKKCNKKKSTEDEN